MAHQHNTRKATYRLCPRCLRAVPAQSGEHFCINDGEPLLERCPCCGKGITSPFTRYCAACGTPFRTQARGHGHDSSTQATLDKSPFTETPTRDPN